jgi:hypothetical protein
VHGIRDVRLFEHFDGNASFTPGRGGLQEMKAQLHEKQSGLFRLRMPIGDIRKTTEFLHQFHEFHTCGHTFRDSRTQVTCQSTQIPLGSLPGVCLAHRAE